MPAAAAQHAPAFRPLYLQLKDLLLRDMETRQWRPGEALPSEIELAARFGVSQGTVRKAIDALAADNLVVRRQGKGHVRRDAYRGKDVDVPVSAHPAQRRPR